MIRISGWVVKMAAENVPDTFWKSTLLSEVGETLNLCFQCGTCTSSCPSGRMTAFRTRQIIRKAQFGLPEEILPSDDLWHCTTCYTCYERCPRGVEIVDIITVLRNMRLRPDRRPPTVPVSSQRTIGTSLRTFMRPDT